jgi:hypothetical protein
MTKKFFMFAAMLMAVAALTFTGCNNQPKDPNEAKIAEVKKAAMGSWEGHLVTILGGEGDLVTVTFTENKITTTGNLTVNITAWKCVDGAEVWVEMDDDMASAMYVRVEGNKMYLAGNSSFVLANFPRELTKK